jgi:hypothetical protein
MRTIETTAVVTPDHTMTLQLPADIPAGPCKVVVVLEAESGATPPPRKKRFTEDWPAYDVVLTDPSCTFRREDLYGDDGR